MKAKRGISLFSHDSPKPCDEHALACVQGFAPVSGNNISVSAFSGSPVRLVSLIKHIAKTIRNSEIVNPVIGSVPVDVVNFRGRVNAIVQEPRQPVSQIVLAAGSDGDVSVTVNSSSGITNSHPGPVDGPSNYSCIGAVIKAFFNGFGDNCKIHFKSPLDLARGRAVVAVRYPALYRVREIVLA
jgi:hypothetical protein